MTYSIVGRDEASGELGVAVQSRAFGSGSARGRGRGRRRGDPVVHREALRARAGSTSSRPAPRRRTRSPSCVAADEQRDFRQVAFLSADGRTAAHTGAACIPDCGHIARAGVSAQGNMLASPAVWHAAADTFETTEGTLAERLLAALDAAEEAGGDFRGREAAALVVVSGDRDEEPWQRVFDLRVDNHAQPLPELRRLHGLAAAYRRRRDFDESSNLEEEVARAWEAGLPEDQVAVTAALVAGAHGDFDEAAARLRPVAESDPRWREAFERYVRLGVIPQAVLDRLE